MSSWHVLAMEMHNIPTASGSELTMPGYILILTPIQHSREIVVTGSVHMRMELEP